MVAAVTKHVSCLHSHRAAATTTFSQKASQLWNAEDSIEATMLRPSVAATSAANNGQSPTYSALPLQMSWPINE